MNKISKSIIINASPEVIWETITDPRKYQDWTYVFGGNSYFEGGWNEGDAIHFLTKDEEGNLQGMVAEIAKSRYPAFISIRHLGYMADDESADTANESLKSLAPAYENYTLDLMDDGQTKFTVDVDTQEEYMEMFEDAWPKALELVKSISEESKSQPMKITINTFVQSSIESVWNGFTQPEHITSWNYASDDWHCPEAVNDLKEGGTFDYIMASKDGKASFHFGGTYTKIIHHEKICYELSNGREVCVFFKPMDGGVFVEETFDAEDSNSYPEQRQGWQAILENFADHVEKNR